jgi:hypothetical protein
MLPRGVAVTAGPLTYLRQPPLDEPEPPHELPVKDGIQVQSITLVQGDGGSSALASGLRRTYHPGDSHRYH